MLEFFGKGKTINYEKTNFAFYGNSDKSKSVLQTTTDAIEASMDLNFKKQYLPVGAGTRSEFLLIDGGPLLLL